MRRSLLVSCLLAVAMLSFGLQVDKQELSKGQGADIQFVNYVGPHTKIDTIAEIVGIGTALGTHLVADQYGEFTYYGKYDVIHAVSTAEADKLDADIFIIDKSATVDDVKNIMRMVSGYLESAYGYPAADAAVLAKFVVYYNAAFRGDMKYIDSAYKQVVTRNVTAENVGIARVYSQWPGNTRMLIPLSGEAAKGNLSSVGSGQLTSPEVIQNLRKEANKGVPDRKAMTELQQRSIDQGQQKVEQQKSQIASQEQKIQQEQKAIQEQKAQIEQQKKQATTPEQQKAVASKEAALEKQKAEVQQQQQQVEQQKKSVAKQEQQLAERQQNVQKERQAIASDQRSVLKQQAPPTTQQGSTTQAVSVAQPGEVLFVYDQEGTGEHLGRLVIIDRVSGKLKASSQLNTVRGRRYERLPNAYLVVAGRTGGTGAVRLVTLDSSSLKMTGESDIAVAPSSTMAVSGSDIYAIGEKEGTSHLARFDSGLKLQAESDAIVNPYSYIVVSGNEVYVQDDQGNILILDKTDLKEKKRSGG